MRGIFTDGTNSFAHVGLGFAAQRFDKQARLPVFTGLFIMYQINQKKQENTLIDLSEFAVGFVLAALS